MTSAWLRQPEPSSEAFIRACAILGSRISWRAGRAVVLPICAYYTAMMGKARAASRNYLSAVLGRKATMVDIFRHVLTFSCTIHDRIFFLSGRYGEYDVTVHGDELFAMLAERDQGCVLLGSHLGSFEVMRALGILERDLPVKVLMNPQNSRRFTAVQNSLNPHVADSIIAIGSAGSMLKAKEHVDSGGMLGILGDRTTSEGERTVQIPFLGRPAPLPVGPLLLASTLDVPVILFFGLYRGGRRYDVHFELLAERMKIDRASRDADLAVWAARYAARLEHYCRLAPYNWFNFFDFWQSTPDAR